MMIENILETEPSEDEKQEQLAAVYEQANRLNHAGYKTTCVYNFEKFVKKPNWPELIFEPQMGMTGVDIIPSVEIKGTKLFIIIIDIDIFSSEKRDAVLENIMSKLDREKVYLETTTSGGYHIILFSDSFIKGKQDLPFHPQNCAAKRKDKVEIFTGGNYQIMVAPSMAKNKHGEISCYKKISEIDLTDINDILVLSSTELLSLISYLKELSQEYHSQTFKHQHKVSKAEREKIRLLYHQLKKTFKPFPLYDGNRHTWITDVKDSHFETDRLTGIQIQTGKQNDGKFLCVCDIDNPSQEFKERFEEVIKNQSDIYAEKTVSGGYHILFKVDENPDIDGNRRLPQGHGDLEFIYSESQRINLAPTSSYAKNYDFTNSPVYRSSEVLSSDIGTIHTGKVDKIRAYIASLELKGRPRQTDQVNRMDRISNQNNEVTRQIYEYGPPSEIDTCIKRIYPDPEKLFHFLDIRHLVCPGKNYMKFFSLADNDGDNPDAILYFNNDQVSENRWSGYSVQDFHNQGAIVSFIHYLARFDIERFEKLIKEIGFDNSEIETPIDLEYQGKTVDITCAPYPSPEIIEDHIRKVIGNEPSSRQSKIIITAPTGSGKTELFYRLAKQTGLKLILALAYTSQVLQGKAKHTVSGVMEGMCERDRDVPTGSIFMTYDKAHLVEKAIDPSQYIMVIDEAHNLVNHSEFRKETMVHLKSLSDKCKMVIYMTATPEYLNYKGVDLVIRLKPEHQSIKNAMVVKYSERSIEKLCNFIMDKHTPETIDVVYTRSIEKLERLGVIIRNKYPEIETEILNASNKNISRAYSNIADKEKLSDGSSFVTGGILFTTNLIVDGVNINDQNIGNLYLVDINSTTDLVQFPSRFRNGYKDYFIFISGKKPEYTRRIRSRQNLVQLYYNLAVKFKESFERINKDFSQNIANAFSAKSLASINLSDRYFLLDHNGNIMENSILLKVLEIESARMCWDYPFIKDFLETGYYFSVKEYGKKNLPTSHFSTADINQGLKLYNQEKEINAQVLKCVLTDEKYDDVKNELILEYLQYNKKTFGLLAARFEIDTQPRTNKFSAFLSKSECSKILWRYCVSLDLGMKDPMVLVENYNTEEINSIRRIYHNLSSQSSGVDLQKDDKYIRYQKIRSWVRSKKTTGYLRLKTDDLKTFMIEFNKKYGKVYSVIDTKGILLDLKDIFDVEMEKKNNSRSYIIKDEWSMKNIRGIDFTVPR